VTLANQGAAHLIDPVNGGPFLGTEAPDGEPEGQPSANADADDGNNDGAISVTSFTAGTETEVTITVNFSDDPIGYGSVWVDLNRDGDWDDAGEQLADDADASAGSYTFTVDLPANAPGGIYFARARVCSTQGVCNTPKGSIAPDGELEDYVLSVTGTGGDGGGGKGGVNILGLFRIGAFDPISLLLMAALGLWSWRKRWH
jgi:hypothetical protein